MNVMTVDGYNAKIEYDPEIDMFRGEILGLTGGADFYGKTPKELRAELKKSLAVFLDVCKEKDIEPRRNYSGKFNLRISPELHERLAIAAQAEPQRPFTFCGHQSPFVRAVVAGLARTLGHAGETFPYPKCSFLVPRRLDTSLGYFCEVRAPVTCVAAGRFSYPAALRSRESAAR